MEKDMKMPDVIWVRMALIQPGNPDHYEPDAYLEPSEGLTKYTRADLASPPAQARTMQKIEIAPGVEVFMTMEQLIAWRKAQGAGDLEALKAAVKGGLHQEIYWELSPNGMVDAVIDYLHQRGLLNGKVE